MNAKQRIEFHNEFYVDRNDSTSQVFEVFPLVVSDNRGSFSEVMKNDLFNEIQYPEWFRTQSWIKQINRSGSSPGTVRGCHAQKGEFCQGKLVEAITGQIYDIIIDARPDSTTYGHWGVFILDSKKQNKLWVPRGFLHSFVTPLDSDCDEFIFQYFCDNVYSHESEFGISPMSILPAIVQEMKKQCTQEACKNMSKLFDVFNTESKVNLSDKDSNGYDCTKWLNDILADYHRTNAVWYK